MSHAAEPTDVAAPAGLARLLDDVEHVERIFEGWEATPRAAAEAYRRAIEALYGEALRRLVRVLKTDPAARAAMRGAASDEVVYAVLRRQEILKPSLNERIEAALEGVRPMLATHGGNVELVSVEPPSVSVRFLGACDGCPASALTFHEGVAKAVQEACPEITSIVQTKGGVRASAHGEEARGGSGDLVSPFALHRGRWRDAGQVSAIPEGGVRALEVGGERLLLARLGGSVTCFENACAHMGLALDDGRVEQGRLECPHHGFKYDLSSGECLTAPSVQLRPRSVRIVGDRIEVGQAR